jgi:hypothetical protein
MNVPKIVRLAAASVLAVDGILHLAGTALTSETTQMAVLAIFGAVYVVIAAGLFWGRRIFTYLGVIAPIFGLIVGGLSMVAMGVQTNTLVVIALDIVVIVCCAYLLSKKISL